MSLHIRHRAEIFIPEAVAFGRSPVGPTSLPPESGPELDREIERRVFSRAPARAVPPFSTEDWTATALLELVLRRTGWKCDLTEQDGTWSAMWIEYPGVSSAAGSRSKILSMITASAPTRALAICRALLKATRCPRWPGISRGNRSDDAAPARLARQPLPETDGAPEIAKGSHNRH
ncbi:MAG: hypothetical protein ABI682_14315 [Acidobacteriota bacterium]